MAEDIINKDMKGGERRMEKVVVSKTLLRDKCPFCGLVIESEYPKQFEYNFETHKRSCPKRPEVSSFKNEE